MILTYILLSLSCDAATPRPRPASHSTCTSHAQTSPPRTTLSTRLSPALLQRTFFSWRPAATASGAAGTRRTSSHAVQHTRRRTRGALRAPHIPAAAHPAPCSACAPNISPPLPATALTTPAFAIYPIERVHYAPKILQRNLSGLSYTAVGPWLARGGPLPRT